MLNYQETGTGYPLVLIHGWGVTYNIWINLAPLLSPHFRLIIVELPGHGDAKLQKLRVSYYAYASAELEALRQHLLIDRWALFSYSVGTRVAEAYSKKYTKRVAAAIYLSPLYLKRPISRTLKLFPVIDRLSPGLVDWWIKNWRLQVLVQVLGFNGRRGPYVHEWRQEIEQQDSDTLKKMLADLPGSGRAPFFVSASPTLFIISDDDMLVDAPKVTPLSRKIDQRTILLANHSAPLVNHLQIAAIIVPFLDHGNLED
jgi:pimeloyl-ACP methyl ester carboxylesterase